MKERAGGAQGPARGTRRWRARFARGARRSRASSGGRGAFPGVRGFSLVELLVVIGVIAILIGLTMSVLVRVRGAQRSVRCVSTLRGIGAAFHAYAQDNKARYPNPGRANLSWEQMLFKYYKGSFACEGDTELYPAVGSSYDWRDTGNPLTTLAGRSIADVSRGDAVLAFEALPGWHARRKINVVRVDGSALTLEDESCFRDLLAPIGTSSSGVPPG